VTLRDFLGKQGLTLWLVGKTHYYPDLAGIQQLGVDPDSSTGQLLMKCDFQIFLIM
jgi:hypothetical protein